MNTKPQQQNHKPNTKKNKRKEESPKKRHKDKGSVVWTCRIRGSREQVIVAILAKSGKERKLFLFFFRMEMGGNRME
jgi:hypothetical protein